MGWEVRLKIFLGKMREKVKMDKERREKGKGKFFQENSKE